MKQRKVSADVQMKILADDTCGNFIFGLYCVGIK